MIRFQINLVPLQYLIGKVFKSSRHSTIVSAGSYVVVMGLIFTLGILAQVGACLKDMKNTLEIAQDVLHLGHHLRRPARAPQPTWRPQTDSTSFQFWTPGIARTKTNAQVAYRLRFGRSLYGWKYNFKTLLMALVSSPNSSGVDMNRLNNLTSRICPGAVTPSCGLWALYRVGAH